MRFAIALISASGIATASALGLAAVLPSGLSPFAAWAALVVGLVAGGGVFWISKSESSSAPLRALDWLMLFVFAIAAARSFFWVGFWSGGELRVQSPYNLGDFALHYGLVNYFASGVSFWPPSPLFFEGALRYPAGADLFNAILVQAGIPILRGFVWAGVAGAALTGLLLWRWAGAFGLAALLFNGGLWAFTSFPPEWTPPADSGIEWKNLFLTVFVTQRGFLWALPAGLYLLIAWRRRLERRREDCVAPDWKSVSIEALLYCLLPLFHLHSFLFFSGLLALAFLFAPSRTTRREFFAIGAIAFIPAGLLSWIVTGGFASGGAIGWHPGWMQGTHGLSFWWMNFGIALPLLAWLGWKIIRSGSRSARIVCGTASGLAIACVLLRFAPWPWDNIKILIWCWLAVAPFLWSEILRPQPVPVRAVLLVVLFASGALSLFDGLSPQHSYSITTRAELENTRLVLSGSVLPGERVACAPDYNQPALLLGHPVYFGYPGHLWSHGYEYALALEGFRKFFITGKRPSYFPPDRPVPVLWGPKERAFFGITEPGNGSFELLKTSGDYSLYRAAP